MYDIYLKICCVYHGTITCFFVSCFCYPKSYIRRDANPQIWKCRYHTHVLASESVEAVVNHEILFRWPIGLLLDISKCFFLLNFVFYFESISANNYKCTWHKTRANNTNLHEPCNSYTEVEILNYLEMTIFFMRSVSLLKYLKSISPVLSWGRFHCRYKTSNLSRLVSLSNWI